MKKKFLLLLTIIICLPLNTNALSKDYKDITNTIVNEKINEDKINVYLFYSATCPHCHDEIKYLNTLENDKINIYEYEVTKNEDNYKLMKTMKTMLNVRREGVPFTIIGEQEFLGYSDTIKNKMNSTIESYLKDEDKSDVYNIPIIGNIDVKKASISLIAVILGFIDGFNPCAMWILLLLINMTLGLKNRKKMFTIGFTFLLTSAIVYFLSMLGISVFLNLTAVSFIRNLIAIIAMVLGILNLKTYVKTRKDTGCHIVDKKKRKTLINKINNIISKKSFLLATLGTILLAISVNLVELACSLGFPTIFLEILSINNIHGFIKIIYLLLYVFFYMLDDLVIFAIAVITLKSKGISTKYNKFVNLIGGILMIIMGLLLIFKPSWIMLNF